MGGTLDGERSAAPRQGQGEQQGEQQEGEWSAWELAMFARGRDMLGDADPCGIARLMGPPGGGGRTCAEVSAQLRMQQHMADAAGSEEGPDVESGGTKQHARGRGRWRKVQ